MIYLDYNATTPIEPRVLDAMMPFLTTHHGNPSSGHTLGVAMKAAITRAREQVAALIGAQPEEIVFTSGGSEASNHCIKGVALSKRNRGNHVITSAVEHPATLNPLRQLEQLGVEHTIVPVDTTGCVDPEAVREAIRPETILVTIMHANNEVGTIQPIREISAICREAGVWFHSDAAQSLSKIPVNVDELGVDFVSLAGHKIYAPAGIGALYIRNGIEIEPLILGAGHESGRRAGTEPTASIVAFGEACVLAGETISSQQWRDLRDTIWTTLHDALGDGVRFNGHETNRLPNTLNVSFVGVNGAELLARCPDIAASPGGAACHGQRPKPSSVLAAMQVPDEHAFGAVRFSVGRDTTEADVREACRQVIDAVRAMSADTPNIASHE